VSDEEKRRARHSQEQGGSRLTAAPAPWPEKADLPVRHDEDLPERLWAFDNLDEATDIPAAEVTGGLVSLGFIRQALRRRRWFWWSLAAAGLLIGIFAYKEFPPSYQASASILLANNPFEQTTSASLDDQVIAQSRTVAGAALRQLGLHEDPGSFATQYTVTVLTNRVLTVVVKAPSYPVAIREANAVATAFLAFQKHQLLTQEALDNGSLQQAVDQVRQNLASIAARIKSVSAQAPSRAKRAELGGLLIQRGDANADLKTLETAARANAANTKVGTAALINGSQVLDPAAPLPQHAKKYLVLYVGGGLLGGLMLGLSIVIIQALMSDRLRRRDDIAFVLGAPVKLSVGKVEPSRWRPGSRGLAGAQNTNIKRIAGYLRRVVPSSSQGPASLAVVAVDDVQVPALCLASLALSCAQPGLRVVVADLCSGSPVARLLGVSDPGVQSVHVDDAHLLVVIPDPDDVTPAGPLRRGPLKDAAAERLVAACASADLLLTLATLDPSLGGDHLAGWAHDAVAVVTAGESRAARIQAVGEMIRLSGMKLISAVLVGADKTDESLGEIDPSVPVGTDLAR
jgi:capsular polysaccharide biosynthesis protein